MARRKRCFTVTETKRRTLVITPLGRKVLRQVERGTYQFKTQGAHKCPFGGKRAP